MEAELHSLAELTAMTGAKRRSVQNWAEAGALVADPASDRQGTGVHRAFRRDEAIIAVILARLAEMHLPIGELKRIAQGLRESLTHVRPMINSCIEGEETIRMTVHADRRVSLIGGMNSEKLLLPMVQLNSGSEWMHVICLDKALSALRGT